MGIAGLILGIIALIIGWIPGISILALIMAIIGLVLAIVDTVKKNKAKDPKKGVGIAGIIVSAIAFIISGIMTVLLFIGVVIYGTALNTLNDTNLNSLEDSLKNVESGLYNYDYDYDYDNYY